MFLTSLVHSSTGMIHLIFSVLALIFGTLVILSTKGTKNHKRNGYLYCISMIGLIVSSFSIYHLYGKFGIFHGLSILSAVTLMAGMLPMFFKKPNRYLHLHVNFMYWSVVGLYAAFLAESLVRIPPIVLEGNRPNAMFYNMVGVALFIVMGFAYYFFFNKQKKVGILCR